MRGGGGRVDGAHKDHLSGKLSHFAGDEEEGGVGVEEGGQDARRGVEFVAEEGRRDVSNVEEAHLAFPRFRKASCQNTVWGGQGGGRGGHFG
jgi:hypothetical protein